MVEVTKQDRDAAAELGAWLFGDDLPKDALERMVSKVKGGNADREPSVLTFAQHRIATEAQTVAEIVAFIRESASADSDPIVDPALLALADAIEQRAYK